MPGVRAFGLFGLGVNEEGKPLRPHESNADVLPDSKGFNPWETHTPSSCCTS